MLRLSQVARPAEALKIATEDRWVELSIGSNGIIMSETTFRQWLDSAREVVDTPVKTRRRFDEWLFFTKGISKLIGSRGDNV